MARIFRLLLLPRLLAIHRQMTGIPSEAGLNSDLPIFSIKRTKCPEEMWMSL
jgi:hypothetical protein